MPSRQVALAAVLALAAGCHNAEAIRFQAKSKRIRADVRALQKFVRKGWWLPIRVRVFFSNAEHGRPLPAARAAREERAVRAQLKEVKVAYERAALDWYAVDVEIDDGEPRVKIDKDQLKLEIRIPPSAKKKSPQVVSADELLDALSEEYDWKRDGRWFDGERTVDLVRALERDTRKLRMLDDQLEQECRRLELLAATVRARAYDRSREVSLSPSECRFARAAQFRATFALHRVLNTLARWRVAAQDEGFSLRKECLAILVYARHLHEGYLGWLLETVVGGRTTTQLWARDWWHRNPLYKFLDGEATLVPLSPGAQPGRVPAGSIRALLSLRLDGDLNSWFKKLDRRWKKTNSSGDYADSPLGAALEPLLKRIPRARRRAQRRRGSSFTAWKELWDARIKNTFTFPLYSAISSIARFLGHTRTSNPAPAVSSKQLQALEGLLRPGDVILVRQDHFLSNAFLPGFWPHAILYLGPAKAWTRLVLPNGTPLVRDPIVKRVLGRYQRSKTRYANRVIEAISAGVVFNSLQKAVQKDYVAVLRPQVSEAEKAAGIRIALSLLGRPYDFDFDFASDDKIVCTELVYRAYNAKLNFRVGIEAKQPGAKKVPGVLKVVGRQTMPANEIARYVVYMGRHPRARPKWRYPGQVLKLIALCDRRDGGPAKLLRGSAAMRALRESVDR